MATTGRTAEPTDSDAVSVLRDATFVRFTVAPTGGSLAAATILAETCAERDVPYQIRVAKTLTSDETESAHVAVGFEDDTTESSSAEVAVDVILDSDTPNVAFEIGRELGGSPDPVLAFAGALADGLTPSRDVRNAAGVERGPGVGIPTADLTTGLAHSTRVRTTFSGDEQGTGAALAELGLPPELDASAHRRLASMVALDATARTSGDVSDRAADAVSDILRPHSTPAGPFETVEGYADVLTAMAWDAPGLGTAFALGSLDRSDALDVWRDHAIAVHQSVQSADPSRHRGVVVAHIEDAQLPVARLIRDYESSEPAVFVVGTNTAVLATTDDNARSMLNKACAQHTTARFHGCAGTRTLSVVEYGADCDEDALVSDVRGVL